MGIYLVEHVEGVDSGILITEKSIYTLAVFIANVLETMLRLVFVFFYQCLIDIEFLNTVQPGILKLLRTRHAVSLHGLAHFHRGVHTDTVETSKLLSIHSSHRSAYDE